MVLAVIVTVLCVIVKETPEVQEITFNREPRVDDVHLTYRQTS